MTEIDRSQFYSGGFFLVRASYPKWKKQDAEVLPKRLISLSECFCKKFDITWTWKPNFDTHSAEEFGIDKAHWDNLVVWCYEQYQNEQLDMYGVFSSAKIARNFIKQFIHDAKDLYLIEVGLPEALGKDNWRDQIPDDGHIIGVEKYISQQSTMSTTGQILGFEVLTYSYHGFGHSWLCSYIHRDMFDLYGIQTNSYGLIDTYDDAKNVYEWIAEDDMKGHRGEPEPYDFWLLVSHPLEEAPQE